MSINSPKTFIIVHADRPPHVSMTSDVDEAVRIVATSPKGTTRVVAIIDGKVHPGLGESVQRAGDLTIMLRTFEP